MLRRTNYRLSWQVGKVLKQRSTEVIGQGDLNKREEGKHRTVCTYQFQQEARSVFSRTLQLSWNFAVHLGFHQTKTDMMEEALKEQKETTISNRHLCMPLLLSSNIRQHPVYNIVYAKRCTLGSTENLKKTEKVFQLYPQKTT